MGEYQDAKMYRVACQCSDNHHDVDVWVELQADREVQEIEVTFYKELYTPFWNKGFNRFIEAWNVLVHGHSRHSGTLIMNEKTAEVFCDSLKFSINDLKNQ
jgi:hypothetical protein